MKQYIVQGEHERLDLVTWNHYQSLEDIYINTVLESSPHLQDKVELEIGDIVYLPEIEITAAPSEEGAIWAS